MDEKERRKWVAQLNSLESKNRELRAELEWTRIKLSETHSRLFDSQAKLGSVQILLRNIEDKHATEKDKLSIKVERARERVYAAEMERNENRRTMVELTDRVAAAVNVHDFTSFPTPSIYLPEPLDPIPSTSRIPQKRQPLTGEEEAYIASILTRLSADLAARRQENEDLQQNFGIQIAYHEAQVAHRDALLQSYVYPSKQHPIPPLPPMPRLPSKSRHPPPKPPNVEESLIMYGSHNRNRILEEEIRQLAKKLEDAKREVAQNVAEPLADTDIDANVSDIYERNIQEAKEVLRRTENEVVMLRRQVDAMNPEDRKDHDDGSSQVHRSHNRRTRRGYNHAAGQAGMQQRHSRSPSPTSSAVDPGVTFRPLNRTGLHDDPGRIHTQIETLAREMDGLRIEEEHLVYHTNHQSDHRTPETNEISFDRVLLIEEECIRLRKSELRLIALLEDANARLCMFQNIPIPPQIIPLPESSPS